MDSNQAALTLQVCALRALSGALTQREPVLPLTIFTGILEVISSVSGALRFQNSLSPANGVASLVSKSQKTGSIRNTDNSI